LIVDSDCAVSYRCKRKHIGWSNVIIWADICAILV
jgi:hypothetical protein